MIIEITKKKFAVYYRDQSGKKLDKWHAEMTFKHEISKILYILI